MIDLGVYSAMMAPVSPMATAQYAIKVAVP